MANNKTTFQDYDGRRRGTVQLISTAQLGNQRINTDQSCLNFTELRYSGGVASRDQVQPCVRLKQILVNLICYFFSPLGFYLDLGLVSQLAHGFHRRVWC